MIVVECIRLSKFRIIMFAIKFIARLSIKNLIKIIK